MQAYAYSMINISINKDLAYELSHNGFKKPIGSENDHQLVDIMNY